MKKIEKVSKTLIHLYNDWLEQNECGSVIVSRYIDKTWREEWFDSEAMRLGNFFEWHVYKHLNVLPPDKPEPPAELLKSGKEKVTRKMPLTVDDYASNFRLAFAKAERVAKLMIASGIKPIKSQAYITKKYGNVTWHGYEDLEAKYKGRKVTIDLKYSGLLYNKWEKMGWVLNSNEQRNYHATQAKHYKGITGKPFYYLVASSTNLIDVEFFEVKISKFAAEQHANKVAHIAENLEFVQEIDGLIDFPDYVKCSKCPLQIHKLCKNALRILEPKEFQVSI